MSGASPVSDTVGDIPRDGALEETFSSLEIEGQSQNEGEPPEAAFDPAQCLFCSHDSVDHESNLEHMNKKHGLFIPHTERLIVDTQTLVGYFHLVIFDYSECLYCGSQRRNPEAARQHMMGKGHCKIDIMDQESEFRDFYDFDIVSEASDASDNSDGPGTGERVRQRQDPVAFARLDDKTVRLKSGRTLGHRSVAKARPFRRRLPDNRRALPETYPSNQVEEEEEEAGTSSSTPASRDMSNVKSASALARSAKREVVFERQLASLRAEDRRSLAHLTMPEQRVVLARTKAQVERARKEENEMKLKIQLKANRSIKK
ncbi:hypothetical protein N0V93_000794 [Gnomoniopsis smithogilvyi]|uniref:ZN622/Rei1/Reh1 zinc finger C2H2-type domain-containing protein n=1 Tax=Gnomoniopsis smithogilvyi TaxID=1191159 RepID=A0A9W9D122_9PEZI|nr:hypothetical protein N0V93_000794 [Gnomoniopsis smithogilvyi]